MIFGAPLDFSRYHEMSDDRLIQRSVTDEIMYELMRLSGQEYVDEYAAVVKLRLAGKGPAPAAASGESQPGEVPADEGQRNDGQPGEVQSGGVQSGDGKAGESASDDGDTDAGSSRRA